MLWAHLDRSATGLAFSLQAGRWKRQCEAWQPLEQYETWWHLEQRQCDGVRHTAQKLSGEAEPVGEEGGLCAASGCPSSSCHQGRIHRHEC